MKDRSDMPDYAVQVGADMERYEIAEALHQRALIRAQEARLIELEERRSMEAAELLEVIRRERDAAVVQRRSQIRRVR